jgi:chromosomal replication initiator protein
VDNARDMWTGCCGILRSQVSEATWRTWFDGVEPLTIAGGSLVLVVPSSLVRDRLEGRYHELLHDALVDATGTDIPLTFEVRPAAQDDSLPEPEPEPARAPGLRPVVARLPFDSGSRDGVVEPSHSTDEEPHRGPDSRYSFETFVIGPTNRFAHAAALSVAEAPARSYNPLFIHGGAGLGKTHLLQAIAHYVTENFPRLHVRYVSTETFMNEFVDAIRNNTTSSFKRRYRDCDVLLIDDVQFMENKESLQEEFFHTFNSLHGASKQIVLTSDRPPKAIATLEVRLRSRFLSGLITDIQPPELETRLAILRTKSEHERSVVPDDVLEFIATNVKENIRELEGALIRVIAFASLNHQPLTLQLAQEVLVDLVASQQPHQITSLDILEATSRHFGFAIEDICGPSRRRPLVIARQISMYVFRQMTDFSYPAIAREFGGRDHTTVIHAVDKITALMKERRQIYEQVTELMGLIREGG